MIRSWCGVWGPELIQIPLVRIMRVLTAMGICEEVAQDTYRANELALAIVEGGKAGVHHLSANTAWVRNRTIG